MGDKHDGGASYERKLEIFSIIPFIFSYAGHKNTDFRIESDVFSSNDEVVSGSEDGYVYIWDLVDAKVVAKLHHPSTKYVHSIAAHPTKQALLSSARDKIFLWELPSDTEEVIEE